jgi:MoCo/4Fe-4S cofactor protein with predicted Tat translocation signal
MEKKYWQSFAELNNNERFQKENRDEFKEDLPFEDVDGSLLDATTPRRDFLKYLGFSTAAATLASCKMPVRKAIPYVNRPEHVVPGLQNITPPPLFPMGMCCRLWPKCAKAGP